ncbi:hypothetical protein [Dactylosporangium roseum]|nr:hypothetical protein [Dactylosporangium roseum]
MGRDCAAVDWDSVPLACCAIGYDPVLGVRPLRRPVQRQIEDPLSEQILHGRLQHGHIVLVDCDDSRAQAKRTKLVCRDTDKPAPATDPIPADHSSGSGDE